jgi:SAM-dependent methyltransferase
MLVNKLNWIAVEQASPDLLKDLDSKMSEFYSSFEKRNDYQKLNDQTHEDFDSNNRLAKQIATYIVGHGLKDVVEIGCGSGKIYGHLLEADFSGSYTGIEMASYVIDANKLKYPNASWRVGSVYDLFDQPAQYDSCIAFFVLEHLIYPERALSSMLRAVKPDGTIILVFPDFVCSGIIPSQKIGLHAGEGARNKLAKGKILDAFISYFEGVMMRSTLKNINKTYGRFVINTNPYCLDKDCRELVPDMDAIYIGNKREVEEWAKENNCSVEYPMGVEGAMYRIAFMELKKK